jgi:uncharacterized protein YdeI (YjbR/CyaY-like superfamily)
MPATAKTFRAVLERMPSRLNWTIVRIPFNVHKLWGTRGACRVRGEINGFAFRTSLFPTGRGGHYLLVNKRMQAGGGARAGSTAQFRLAPGAAPRPAAIPAELAAVFKRHRALENWFNTNLNPSSRREIARHIAEPKNPESRFRRAHDLAERLLSTMEAERELPPLLQVAFARGSRARAGWERMSPRRRRGHLLGIFYYRTPEARARRLEKALADAASLVR